MTREEAYYEIWDQLNDVTNEDMCEAWNRIDNSIGFYSMESIDEMFSYFSPSEIIYTVEDSAQYFNSDDAYFATVNDRNGSLTLFSSDSVDDLMDKLNCDIVEEMINNNTNYMKGLQPWLDDIDDILNQIDYDD